MTLRLQPLDSAKSGRFASIPETAAPLPDGACHPLDSPCVLKSTRLQLNLLLATVPKLSHAFCSGWYTACCWQSVPESCIIHSSVGSVRGMTPQPQSSDSLRIQGQPG